MTSTLNFLQNPLPETISELEAQIALLDEERKNCADTIRELMAREDPQKGVFFPAEIHALRQQRNILESHRQFRAARVNRLRFESQG